MYKRCDEQIQLVAKDERVENLDFLIWSGLPSGFEKAARVRFHIQSHSSSSILISESSSFVATK